MATYTTKLCATFFLQPAAIEFAIAVNAILDTIIAGGDPANASADVLAIANRIVDHRNRTSGCHFEHDKNPPHPGLAVSHDESADVEVVVDILQATLAHFGLRDRLAFQWSNDCSAKRDDAYGGGAVLFDKDGASWLSTETWLEESPSTPWPAPATTPGASDPVTAVPAPAASPAPQPTGNTAGQRAMSVLLLSLMDHSVQYDIDFTAALSTAIAARGRPRPAVAARPPAAAPAPPAGLPSDTFPEIAAAEGWSPSTEITVLLAILDAIADTNAFRAALDEHRAAPVPADRD